jgi:hypothetical protein
LVCRDERFDCRLGDRHVEGGSEAEDRAEEGELGAVGPEQPQRDEEAAGSIGRDSESVQLRRRP